MSDLNISNEPCACPPGGCAALVEPDTDCINRLTGDVRVRACPNHAGQTWHHNGMCLKCRKSTTQ